MRLLYHQADGTLCHTDNLDNTTYPYAILSHRWGAPDEEVSYNDIVKGCGQDKKGYQKLSFCGQQALKDGLQYFWIDTCCIDKTNQSELSEAITSMFRWYKDAAKCYVYLSDVLAPDSSRPNLQQPWATSFCGSQWFKRGWTLQELLAPRVVEFYAQNGVRLGDKRSLERLIYEATGISVWALQGTPLSKFSVEERLLWASSRQTTRKEDEAYCLQGIFDVYIPIMYGERENAFVRLRKAIEESQSIQTGESPSGHMHPRKRQKVVDVDVQIEQDDQAFQSLAFPEMNHRLLSVEPRHQHTCEWILDTTEYNGWLSSSHGLLWIKGKPGAGKSTVMAFLYDQLEKQAEQDSGHVSKIRLAFFLSARGAELQRTFHGLLRSLICQLFLQDINASQRVHALFTDKTRSFGSQQKNWEWHLSELSSLFTAAVVDTAQQRPVTVFVDALDEAGEETARVIAEYFHRLNDEAAAARSRLRICMSCRHYPIVTSRMNSLELVVEEHNNKDIAFFIRDKLCLDRIAHENPDDYDALHAIRSELTERTQGIFQWARLIIPLIQRYIDAGESPHVVREKLQKVPSKLKDVYVYILQNIIDEEDCELSFRLFQWVCLATRPLTLIELRYALAIEGQELISSDNRMKLRVKPLSGGLVEVVHNSSDKENRVQVIHQSVNEFFLAEGLALLGPRGTPRSPVNDLPMHDLISECHATLYKLCVAFLKTEEVRRVYATRFKPRLTRAKFHEDHRDLLFVEYATVNLFIHAQKAGVRRCHALPDEVITLQRLLPEWIFFYKLFYYYGQACPTLATQLLHVASAAGMADLITLLSQDNSGIDVRDGKGRTPLHLAADQGHQNVAVILKNAGSDLNAVDKEGKTPLIHAAGRGHRTMVQWLLHNGALLDHDTGSSGGALYAAAESGYVALIKSLIDAGADVNAQGGRYGNALQAASCEGHEQVVQILLRSGADVNAQGGVFGNALQAASVGNFGSTVQVLLEDETAQNRSQNGTTNTLSDAYFLGNFRLAQMLLDKGADINMQGGEYGNALQAASIGGTEQVVRLLLDRGANVNTRGGRYDSALQAASLRGAERIVQMLLEKDAEVNAQGGKYGNALQAASFGGHERLVQLLLDHGAEVNARGGKYGNSLLAASYGGSEQVVRVLFNNGADINMQGGELSTALQAASLEGREQLVQILLDNGADVDAQGGRFGNALQAASLKGFERVVQLLLNHGAKVNVQGGQYGTALQAASSGGHEHVVQLLLDHGSDLNARGGYYGGVLQAAAAGGHERLVQLLLDKGAEVNTPKDSKGNALQVASVLGHEQIVQLLLDKGADVNGHGGFYHSALQAASTTGSERLVHLLLEQGAEVNTQGGYYGNALQAASGMGYIQVVQKLLDHGAQVNAQGGFYGNALQAASAPNHLQITSEIEDQVYDGDPITLLRVLLDHGADVNAQGGHYGYALQAASTRGDKHIVQLLLDHGAEVDLQGGHFLNVLQAASFAGSEPVVQLFLDKGVEVNIQGGHFGNALQAASWRGHRHVVQLLLDKGADVNAQGGKYGNALQAASQFGHKQVVDILLTHGARMED